jgi:hypothetical protein
MRLLVGCRVIAAASAASVLLADAVCAGGLAGSGPASATAGEEKGDDHDCRGHVCLFRGEMFHGDL